MTADDKGAVVLLPYGLEGYAPKKHTMKENGGYLTADDAKVQFKVVSSIATTSAYSSLTRVYGKISRMPTTKRWRARRKQKRHLPARK
jgi:small subunit ribosomal protein S1